jgi:acetoin utilization protein AcuB
MSPAPHTIGRKQSMARAHEVMREHGIRHLPVLDGGRLVGIVSDRDLHLVETLKDVDPKVVTVDEAMTADPYVVQPQAKLGETVSEMARKKLGSAVVVENNHVVGIFTVIDAMHALAWVLELAGDD